MIHHGSRAVDGRLARRSTTYSAPKEQRAWRSMLERCYNPRRKGYEDYGGRGITVCERWRRNHVAFLRDMGPAPTGGHSLDRINVNGNYEPGNCRWATAKEQANNRRRKAKQRFRESSRCLHCEMTRLQHIKGYGCGNFEGRVVPR